MGSVKATRIYIETPVVFGRDKSLVGAVCRPAAALSPKPFVVFLNAGIVHRCGPHRMSVKLARALAEVGVSSLRFDLSGIGDSVMPRDAPPMAVQERVQIDIDEALEFARERYHATSFVMGGLCSGADNALRTAARATSVVGLFLLDLNVTRTAGYHVRLFVRRLFSRTHWTSIVTGRHPAIRALRNLVRSGSRGLRSREEHLGAEKTSDAETPSPALEHDAVIPHPMMREYLHTILARDVHLLCIFTAGIESQYNYERQFLRLFPGLDFGTRLSLQYFKDCDHTFTGPALQERLRQHMVTWISGTAFRDATDGPDRVVPPRGLRFSLTPRSRLRRRGELLTSRLSDTDTDR